MATDLVRVTRIDGPWRTADPSVEGYTVTGTTIEAAPRTLQVQTINYWMASVCERSIERNRLVWIAWRDTRWAKDIVTAREDDSKWQHDGQAAS